MYRNNSYLMEVAEKATVYRLGNSTIRLQGKTLFGLVAGASLAVLLILYVLLPGNSGTFKVNPRFPHAQDIYFVPVVPYNNTYPLTKPEKLSDGWIKYRIGVIADMDLKAKSLEEEGSWISYLKTGHLLYNPDFREVKVEWEAPPVGMTLIKSQWSYGNRGMELSELLVFNGKLYGVDDRTGVVYEIDGSLAIPWVILTDGNGHHTKGFKSEWATVKDEHLFVGGFGKEWTSPAGELINDNPMWVKRISTDGRVQHWSWRKNFIALREKLNIKDPGYVIHETGGWSEQHRKWYFLPRRVSNDRYDDKLDEHMGANHMLIAEEDFSSLEDVLVGDVTPTHGFSSFKFLPDSGDNIIVALKSEEDDGNVSTYIIAFDVKGKILLPETLILKDYKFEGIEFI